MAVAATATLAPRMFAAGAVSEPPGAVLSTRKVTTGLVDTGFPTTSWDTAMRS